MPYFNLSWLDIHTPRKGCAFQPLSRICFNSPEITPDKAVPFTQDLAVQDDQHVVCLPFTISPLTLGTHGSLPSIRAANQKLVVNQGVNVNFVSHLSPAKYLVINVYNRWRRTRC